jgi:hypothetical protein
MADNFDLKKFLKESKALENLNPVVAKGNLSEGGMREKIREYILNELGENAPDDYDYEEEEDNYDYSNDFYDGDPNDFGDTDEFDGYGGYDIDEAKKKDKEADVEDVEVTDTEVEDVPAEDAPAEEAPAAGGGLEDIAANMKGTENDLMKNLMDALSIAKGMGNEKLETQIGNTLKFFVSEYIGGSEQ